MDFLDWTKDFFKRITWGKVFLDIGKAFLWGIIISVLFCIMLENGWLLSFGINEVMDVSGEMYIQTQALFVGFTIITYLFINSLCGKYFIPYRCEFIAQSVLHPDGEAQQLKDDTLDDVELATIIKHNAIHEAGHIVMAKRFGYSILEEVVYPNPHIATNSKKLTCLDDIKHQAMVYFAGNCALHLLSQDFYPYYANFGEVDDYESAYEYIKRYIVLEDNQFSYADVYYEHHGVQEKMEELAKDWFAETETILKESIDELRKEAARLELLVPKGDV